MYKASAVGDATGPGCNEVGGGKTSASGDGTEMMDNDVLEKVESKIDIAAEEKQTDANNKIYYTSEWKRNLNDARQNQ